MKSSLFAHLLGASSGEPDGDDDDDLKQRADESDEDYAKRMEEEERKQRADESDEDYAKRMEELDKKNASAEDDEGEDDDGDNPDDDKKAQAAKQSERLRCAKIFQSSAAASRPDLAAHLAFNTGMASADAIAMLRVAANVPSQKSTAAATPHSNLSQRMARIKLANPGTDGVKSSQAVSNAQAMADQIIAAGKLRRGEA